VRVQELAREAEPKFIDEGGRERIGVSYSDVRVSDIDWEVGPPSRGVVGEGRSGPGHAVVIVFARTKQPFHEVLALVAPLVVNLERVVLLVEAAPYCTQEIVADSVGAADSHGTATQRIQVVGRGEGLD